MALSSRVRPRAFLVPSIFPSAFVLFHILLVTTATAHEHAAPTISTSPSIAPDDNPHAYIVVFRDNRLGTDPSALSVQINGKPANDVLLHNSTTLSFRVPVTLLRDRQTFDSSYVDIFLRNVRLLRLPLHTLKSAIVRVNMDDLRRDLQSRRTRPPPSSSPLPAADVLRKAEALLKEDTSSTTSRALPLLHEAHKEGNLRASTALASLLIFAPHHISRDLTFAAALLRNASAVGLPDAQSLLAFLHATGIAAPSVPKDIPAALLLWTVAARAGSAYAKMAMAFRWYYGTDLPEDCERAAEYYREVADQVYVESKREDEWPLRWQHGARKPTSSRFFDFQPDTGLPRSGTEANSGIDNEDVVDVMDLDDEIRPPQPNGIHLYERKYLSNDSGPRSLGVASEIVQYSQHLAERGDASAQMMMGRIYYHGAAGMPRDMERARKLFEQAARSGRIEAHAALGLVDLRSAKNDSAVRNLRIAASQENPWGLYGLGYANLYGIGTPKNEVEAARLFKLASRHKNSEAYYNLGVMHGRGVGVQKSTSEMRKYFEVAARYGHLRAAYRLGVMLLEGDGVTMARNCQQGTVYLKEVAQRGQWNKIIGMALRAYENGRHGDALMRYLRAGHAGIEEAQFNSAYMFEHGQVANAEGAAGFVRLTGFRRNLSKYVEAAMEMYQMSAAQSNPSAMVRMGDLAFGTGTDYARAMQAYERAVKHKNAEAMFNLGWMHARGVGMATDRHMAKRYFDRAAETDQEAAIPAAMALFWLRHGDEIANAEEALMRAWDRVRKFVGIGGTRGAVETERSELQLVLGRAEMEMWVELVVVSVLLGLLVLVVNVRQRRLMAETQREQPREEQEAEVADGAAEMAVGEVDGR